MKKELFLFTRTKTTDYRYILPLPRGISAQAKQFVQKRLLAMQNGEADGTLYFFPCPEDAVLLRAVAGGESDAFGRPILALEGFWIPAPQIRRFWLELWATLPGFFVMPPMYASLLNGENAKPRVSAEKLLRTLRAAGQTAPNARGLFDSLRRALRPVPFTYSAGRLRGRLSAVPRAPWMPEEPRSCRVLLRFDRREKRMLAEAVALGDPEYIIARSAPVKAGRDGWRLDRVEAAAQGLCDRLDESGWDWGGAEEL